MCQVNLPNCLKEKTNNQTGKQARPQFKNSSAVHSACFSSASKIEYRWLEQLRTFIVIRRRWILLQSLLCSLYTASYFVWHTQLNFITKMIRHYDQGEICVALWIQQSSGTLNCRRMCVPILQFHVAAHWWKESSLLFSKLSGWNVLDQFNKAERKSWYESWWKSKEELQKHARLYFGCIWFIDRK